MILCRIHVFLDRKKTHCINGNLKFCSIVVPVLKNQTVVL